MPRFIGGPFSGELYTGEVSYPGRVLLVTPAIWRRGFPSRSGKPLTVIDMATVVYEWDGEQHLIFKGELAATTHHDMPSDRDPELPIMETMVPSIPVGPTHSEPRDGPREQPAAQGADVPPQHGPEESQAAGHEG